MRARAPYTQTTAVRLVPLLESIARELQERGRSLEALENRMEELGGAVPRDVVAEAATQRRELRHAHEELERLGCTIVGEAPLTVRIPTRKGEGCESLLWQAKPPLPSWAGAPETSGRPPGPRVPDPRRGIS